MRISAQQISDITKCPRYHFLIEKYKIVKKKPESLNIINYTIKQSCLKTLQTNYRPDWRVITNHVDKKMYKDIDLSNEKIFEAKRKETESILLFLRRWYYNFFLKEEGYMWPDITIQHQLNGAIVVSDIPFIQEGDIPRINYFCRNETQNRSLSLDMKARVDALLVSLELDCSSVTIRKFLYGKTGMLKEVHRTFTKKHLQRTMEYINQIIIIKRNGFTYPSLDISCKNCILKYRCSL